MWRRQSQLSSTFPSLQQEDGVLPPLPGRTTWYWSPEQKSMFSSMTTSCSVSRTKRLMLSKPGSGRSALEPVAAAAILQWNPFVALQVCHFQKWTFKLELFALEFLKKHLLSSFLSTVSHMVVYVTTAISNPIRCIIHAQRLNVQFTTEWARGWSALAHTVLLRSHHNTQHCKIIHSTKQWPNSSYQILPLNVSCSE